MVCGVSPSGTTAPPARLTRSSSPPAPTTGWARRSWASTDWLARSARLLDGDDDPLHLVVRVAADVPLRFCGLCVAGFVARAARENMTTGLCVVPLITPAPPGPPPELRRVELCALPRRAVVGADFNRCDRGEPGPRAALDRHAAGLHRAFAGHEVGGARRHH